MKKLLFALLTLIFFACNSSQKQTNDNASEAALDKRLSEFMKANDDMNLEKVIDYTYPKLFEIVPRKDLLKAMEDGFDNEEVKVQLDSLKVDSLYPIFNIGKDSYAKVQYSMLMLMNYNPGDSTNNEENDRILQSLAAAYGEEKVSLDAATGTIRIHVSSPMVAIVDKYAKEWSFVNLKENDPMTDKLFSKELLEKLATYK